MELINQFTLAGRHRSTCEVWIYKLPKGQAFKFQVEIVDPADNQGTSVTNQIEPICSVIYIAQLQAQCGPGEVLWYATDQERIRSNVCFSWGEPFTSHVYHAPVWNFANKEEP